MLAWEITAWDFVETVLVALLEMTPNQSSYGYLSEEYMFCNNCALGFSITSTAARSESLSARRKSREGIQSRSCSEGCGFRYCCWGFLVWEHSL